MRSLPMPAEEAGAFFQHCLSRIRNADLKRRLSAVRPNVAAAAASFATKAEVTQLHHLRPHNGVGPDVTTSEMVAVYTSRMAKAGQPGRAVYDALRLAAPNDQCPLCGQRPVDSLDHHLPKMEYPALAVAPVNLVPACFSCNKVKETHIPTHAEEETLHPYFDDVSTATWLVASVRHTQPAAVVFTVQHPVTWPQLLFDRVTHHVRLFGIGPLYAMQAAVELTNIRLSLHELHAIGGATAVHAHLDREARSRQLSCLNSWQSALYTALANDLWYCDGGFGGT